MRFLADMGVSLRVVEWLRSSGHDAIHLRDEGLQILPNGEIFQKAHREERIVLTFDLDFGEIVAASGGRSVSVVRRTLTRRSQKDKTTWMRMRTLVDDWLPAPNILHPWPNVRFAVTHPRWEPYAGKPHVRFCAGGSAMSAPTATPN